MIDYFTMFSVNYIYIYIYIYILYIMVIYSYGTLIIILYLLSVDTIINLCSVECIYIYTIYYGYILLWYYIRRYYYQFVLYRMLCNYLNKY